MPGVTIARYKDMSIQELEILVAHLERQLAGTTSPRTAHRPRLEAARAMLRRKRLLRAKKLGIL